MATPTSITSLLIQYGQGGPEAVDRLLPRIYDELLGVARRERFRWQGFDAPGTYSLVHEAYLKLVDQTQVDWKSRAQFFYLASLAMRNILIDNARARRRLKRGAGRAPVTLEDDLLVTEARGEELLAVDEALRELDREDERLARIVQCRFFGGLTIEETAEALDVSPATVKRGWNTARAWLFERLQDRSPA